MLRLFILISFFASSNVNATLTITNSSGTNVSISSLTPNLISASGYGFSPTLDKIDSNCCVGQQSALTIDFSILGTQKVIVEATLTSEGNTNSTLSLLRIQRNDPLKYILGAVSQAEDSSLGGDAWITDYTSLGTLELDRKIILTEGSYSIFARAFADQYQDYTESSFSFSITPVPVPSGIWLLSSGLFFLLNIKKNS